MNRCGGLIHDKLTGLVLVFNADGTSMRVNQRRTSPRCGQRILHRVMHGLVHFAAVSEAHFDFGRMHIDIHPRRVDANEQRIDRLALAMQHVFVGATGAVGQHLVAHEAAIDVGKLLIRAGAGGIGDARAAPHAHGLLAVLWR